MVFLLKIFYVDKPEKLVYDININKISHPPMVEGVGPSLCGGLLFFYRAGCEDSGSVSPITTPILLAT
jgi:hypothetical protein